MKKLRLLQLALSLAMLIAISTTNSFANTKTKFAPIVDASQMNMAAVNKLSAVKPEGGSFAPSIGTVIPWGYTKHDPVDTNCLSSENGGSGAGGVCKWLECNGQEVNPSIYPEYVSLSKSIQTHNFTGKMPRGRIKTETERDAHNQILEFKYKYKATYSMDTPEGSIDGIVGFRTGKSKESLEGITAPSSVEVNTYSLNATGAVSPATPVKYLIRVSN